MITDKTSWVTSDEASVFLNRNVRAIRGFARDGVIPARKIGKYWEFDIVELRRWKYDNPKTVCVIKKSPEELYREYLYLGTIQAVADHNGVTTRAIRFHLEKLPYYGKKSRV